jgi:hypothetical protein
MPRRDHCPLPGVYSGFDVTPWAGADLFTVGIAAAPTVTVPTVASGSLGDPDAPGVGEYVDVIEAMTGFGSETDTHLGALLTAAWAALGRAGTVSVTIDEDDRIAVSLAGAPTTIELTSGGGSDPLGLGGAIEVDNGETTTAAGDWVRGVVDATATITVGDGVGTEVVTLPRCQDVRILVREREGFDDLDDRGRWCLEHGDATIRLGVTADGRAWWATSREGVLTGMTWDSVTFRDRLGFSGNETITTWGDWRGQIADHPLPGVVHPTRPIRRQTPRSESVGEEQRLVGGGYSSVHVHTVRGWRIEMWVDGPLDSGLDLHRHWLEMLTDPALCASGRRITLYQDVGDSRRALDPRRVTADQPAYDTLYTSEDGPYRGRIVGFVNPATGRELEVEQEGRFRRRYPVAFVMDEEG